MMEPKKIKVHLAWNADQGVWEATTFSPKFKAKGARTELAQLYISKAVREELGGREFVLEPEYELPKDLQEAIDKANECARQYAELEAELPKLRTNVGRLGHGRYAMMQSELARFMGISQGFLQKTMTKQDAEAMKSETARFRKGDRKP
jgi:hypothetical protein